MAQEIEQPSANWRVHGEIPGSSRESAGVPMSKTLNP